MENWMPKSYRPFDGKDYWLAEFWDYDKFGDSADRIAFEHSQHSRYSGAKVRVVKLSHGVAIYSDR